MESPLLGAAPGIPSLSVAAQRTTHAHNDRKRRHTVGTFWVNCRQPLPNRVTSELPVIRPERMLCKPDYNLDRRNRDRPDDFWCSCDIDRLARNDWRLSE